MNWKTYEETVKNIYQVFGANNGVKIECYGNSCKCTGKSGVEHQIDVLTVHTDGIHYYKTFIECKYWNEKIHKDILMKVLCICQDCNLHKGVIVSKMGFTPDAIKFAEFNGIGLVELREPLKQDTENRIEGINVIISPEIPKIIHFQNISYEEDTQKTIYLDVDTSNSYYLFPDGSHQTIKHLIDDWFREIKQAEKFNEVMEKFISFPNDTYLKSPSAELSIRVKGVYIQGLLLTNKTTVEIKSEDRIWLFMKSIFEKKMFIIWHNEHIQEIPYL